MQRVGVFQMVMNGLNIDNVKCIRDALIKVYLPIIMPDLELNALCTNRKFNQSMIGID